jgi:hypothetical protein
MSPSMRPIIFIRRFALPICGVIILSLSAQAGTALLENSPFLPPGAVAAIAQQAAPLELRSIVKSDGQYEFSLYDSARKQSIWVHLKEPGHDFLVKAYDPANSIVTVEHRSRTYTLTLKEAKITPLNTPPDLRAAALATPSTPTEMLQPETLDKGVLASMSMDELRRRRVQLSQAQAQINASIAEVQSLRRSPPTPRQPGQPPRPPDPQR